MTLALLLSHGRMGTDGNAADHYYAYRKRLLQ